MKIGRLVRSVVVSFAALGMCLPTAAFAVETAKTPQVADVSLKDGGMLLGQVVDLQGAGVTGVSVSVKAKNREVAATTTAAEGRFAVKGLRGGVYHVAAAEGQGVYRLWSAGTAPPSAQDNAVVYTQYGGGGGFSPKALLTNPIVIAGVVATAVAVPLALSKSSPSSP